MTNTGKVNIRGKEYLTVAYRIKQFRVDHPDWQIHTDIIKMDDDRVVVRAEIADSAGVYGCYRPRRREAFCLTDQPDLSPRELRKLSSRTGFGLCWIRRFRDCECGTRFRTLSTSRRTRTLV
jgi:hypothetical protein